MLVRETIARDLLQAAQDVKRRERTRRHIVQEYNNLPAGLRSVDGIVDAYTFRISWADDELSKAKRRYDHLLSLYGDLQGH